MPVADVAASFQEAVVDVLTRKAVDAAVSEGIEDILIGGGVAANSRLRVLAEERAAARGIRVRVPRPGLCTDNGAMVAALGAEMVARGRQPSRARPARRLLAAGHLGPRLRGARVTECAANPNGEVSGVPGARSSRSSDPSRPSRTRYHAPSSCSDASTWVSSSQTASAT